jgi:hypothetical protein
LADPSCDSLPMVMCFRDTAYVHSDPDPADPNPLAAADWIWFGAAGDSIEIFAPPGAAHVSTNFGQEHESNQNTAPYFRHRLTHDGLVAIWVTFDQILGDTMAYALRIHREGPEPPAALRATGQWATLTIVSRQATDSFSVVPLTVARSLRNRSEWKVLARPYKVALVPDSLYEVCRLPCSAPDIVKLTPSAKVTKRY